ncbi:hypothetical protein L3Y34_006734 [Caenorhabditis briggsae]|uniref:Uncharacterized protein n=1 Tax=Caenorhabditis briggsae TaxID=6238 RepID=A0AAE9A0H6_CAEBR|nr:hypothetical protein L3Y34_006734 [Caenorhabditis briggsae]
MYGTVIGFLAVQFKYRACVLAKQAWVKYFDSWILAFWVLYTFSNGVIWAAGTEIVRPDEYAYQYLSHEIMTQYGVDVRKIALFVFVAYVRRILVNLLN